MLSSLCQIGIVPGEVRGVSLAVDESIRLCHGCRDGYDCLKMVRDLPTYENLVQKGGSIRTYMTFYRSETSRDMAELNSSSAVEKHLARFILSKKSPSLAPSGSPLWGPPPTP